MKEHGDKGSTTTRGLLHPQPSPHLSSPSSEKMLRDQELHHLVTSSIPSPPYHHHHTGLSLMNAQAGIVLDPIYSTHFLASLVAANAANANSPLTPGARFQLPIPIPLALQPASHQHHLQPHLHHQRNLFHHLPATAPTTAFAGLPGATLPNQAQLDILSSWVANSDDKKITSTTSSTPNSTVSTGSNKSTNNKTSSNKTSNKSKKNGNSEEVSAKNNKNIQNGSIQKQKRSGAGNNKKNGKAPKTERNRGNTLLLNEGIVSSSENELPMLKDAKVVVVEKEPMMTINESIIQPFIFDTFPPGTPKSGRKGGDSGGTSPHNNNNNTITSLKSQTSPGSGGGQNGGPRDKVFTCPTCNRCFGYKHVLQNHERTHTGEKPFECNICSKKFTRDHHLKTHMRLHTGEKPYQCTHCDRQFVQVANLRRHLRVHTGERPYACELCSSRFSDSNQLKAHMLIHKGEKPYSCTECGGKFRRRHHLAHHKCSSSSPDTSEEVMTPMNSSMSSSSPPQLLTPSSTGGGGDIGTGIGGGASAEKSGRGQDPPGKRGRKCRETRRIIRLEGIPVATQAVTTSTASGALVGGGLGGGATPTFHLPVVPPEQDMPEDLSMTGGLRVRHYSGSSSSVTASSTPSPRGPGLMLLSTRPYSSSSSFEDPPDLYASDEDLRAADSSTNGKVITENESSSMSD